MKKIILFTIIAVISFLVGYEFAVLRLTTRTETQFSEKPTQEHETIFWKMAEKISYRKPIPKDDLKNLYHALIILVATCENLEKYWDDVESAMASYLDPGWSPKSKKHAWYKLLTFTLYLKKELRVVPRHWNVKKRQYTFFLGAGVSPPGIVADDIVTQNLCGPTVGSFRDGFLPVAELAIVDNTK